MTFPVPRSLFSKFQFLSSTPLSRLLSTAAAADEFWRLLRSNASSRHTPLERALSLSKTAALTPAVVDSVLRRPSASTDDADRSLALLRFFVWAGLQPRRRHSAAAYAAASDAIGLPRHPQFLSLLLDSYRADAHPISVKTFKILLALCHQAHLPDEALSLLRRMPELGCRPDTSSYNTVLRVLADCGRGEAGAVLLDEMPTAGLSPDVTTYVLAVRGLAAAGKVEAARGLVDQMRENGCVPNVIVYSALVDGACASDDVDSAIEILREMECKLDDGCVPNVATYTCLIKCLCGNGRMEEALAILDRMGKKGCLSNQVTVRTLVNGFCSVGRIREAYELIERVVGEGCILIHDCYSLLVVSLVRVQEVEEAVKVFKMMLEKVVRPSGLAVNSLLRKLCKDQQFMDVYSLVLEMDEKGWICIDSDVYSHLLLGICEGGHLAEASRLVEKIVEREIMLQDDCIDGVIQLLSKVGEHNLTSKIIRLKQPGIP